MNACILHVDLRSYWHAGGGRGKGAVLDAVAHRDAHGMPVLPGRHLKGLLRDALERAARWGWDGYAGMAESLFGQRTEEDGRAQRVPAPGSLRVTDARLPAEVAAWLAGVDKGKASCPLLFRALFSTAVEHDTGSATNRTLRGIEVVVPLALAARIEAVPGRELPPEWKERLAAVLPLIDAVGGQRTRGLGRAVLRLEETQ